MKLKFCSSVQVIPWLVSALLENCCMLQLFFNDNPHTLTWAIKAPTKSFSPVENFCRLCNHEKVLILYHPELSALNLRNELFGWCPYNTLICTYSFLNNINKYLREIVCPRHMKLTYNNLILLFWFTDELNCIAKVLYQPGIFRNILTLYFGILTNLVNFRKNLSKFTFWAYILAN